MRRGHGCLVDRSPTEPARSQQGPRPHDKMARPEGLEPSAYRFEAHCSIQLSYDFLSTLNACRARSFQASSCFCHTISTPILTGVTLPSLATSPVSIKREIALTPATVFLRLANSSVFHIDFPLVASAMNSSFV